MLAHVLILAASFMAAKESKPDFVLETRIVGGANSKDLQAPKIFLFDGQTANIADQSQTPFVTAIEKVAGAGNETAQQPVITVLSAGITIEAKVRSMGDSHASVDITVENSKIASVKEQKAEHGVTVQSPTLECTKVRTLIVVRLGEKTTIAGDDQGRSVELVVRRN